jgi:hypothetical protein
MKVTKRKMTIMVKTSTGMAKMEKTLGKSESEVVTRSETRWRNKLAERRENGG